MRSLVVIGAKEHAKVMVATLEDLPRPEWNVVGFLDDNPALQGSTLLGRPVLGPTSMLDELARAGKVQGALVGVSCGHMPVRARLFRRALELGLEVPTVISPAAFVHRTAKVGRGGAVFAGAVIHAFATVGDNFVAYSNAVVEHECVLGDNVYLGPNVSFCANCRVGANTFIATGASVICPRMGSDVIVGAGSAVIENVADGAVVAGVPARVLRTRSHEQRQSSYILRREEAAQ
jgi:sugar O-acyltransferase (sialic acid O-acetyltransferase NeuD family)